ncbi:hypothetical protein [Lewinella sp. IMCC34191]|uniref:hypothetical protein n=1 Tax=Lewinella sp. IMCC34191 TaxID=2259172 RepID=UPI000E238D80|nr:hypothetical protein [Lewinella sp. IMCC34191]
MTRFFRSPQLMRKLTYALLLAIFTLPLAAQQAKPALRGAADGDSPQKHLVKTVYGTVIYPPAALESRRTGPYLLKIYVNEDGSDFKAMPLTNQVSVADPMNLTVVAPDKTQGAPVSGQMKVAGDRALLEETERMGRYLVSKGFDRADGAATDSIELVLYYQLEE